MCVSLKVMSHPQVLINNCFSLMKKRRIIQLTGRARASVYVTTEDTGVAPGLPQGGAVALGRTSGAFRHVGARFQSPACMAQAGPVWPELSSLRLTYFLWSVHPDQALWDLGAASRFVITTPCLSRGDIAEHQVHRALWLGGGLLGSAPATQRYSGVKSRCCHYTNPYTRPEGVELCPQLGTRSVLWV